MHRLFPFVTMLLGLISGCSFLPTGDDDPALTGQLVPHLPNPVRIPVTDHELAWNTIVDTVDDYFEIAEERRVQLVGGVLTDGHIITNPKAGAGIPEFWRKDSTPGFERWHSTFQTIRRRADLRVIPAEGGYDVQVIVRKELEDLDRPEQASIGKNLRRHNGSIVKQSAKPRAGPVVLGWIPLGRDVSLEQKMLTDIQARFVHVKTPTDIQLLPPVQPLIDFRHRAKGPGGGPLGMPLLP